MAFFHLDESCEELTTKQYTDMWLPRAASLANVCELSGIPDGGVQDKFLSGICVPTLPVLRPVPKFVGASTPFI